MAEHLVKIPCHIVFILKLYSKFLLGLFHCPAYFQLAPLPEELCSSGNAADYQRLIGIMGLSPLRGSLRATPIACVCGWTESSGLAESLQDSLPKLLLDGRVPLAAFFGRLLCRPSLHRQVFALPPHCCSPSSGGRQPTLLVAGYSV